MALVKASDAPIENEDSSFEEEESYDTIGPKSTKSTSKGGTAGGAAAPPLPVKKSTSAKKSSNSAKMTSQENSKKRKSDAESPAAVARKKRKVMGPPAKRSRPVRRRQSPDKFRPSSSLNDAMAIKKKIKKKKKQNDQNERESESLSSGAAGVARNLAWLSSSAPPVPSSSAAATIGPGSCIELPLCDYRLFEQCDTTECMYCDGCGEAGTIKDCSLCGRSFSLTNCTCGLVESSSGGDNLATVSKAQAFAKDWQSGKVPGCFHCTKGGGNQVNKVLHRHHFARRGELSMLAICLEPQFQRGVWGHRNRSTMAQFLGDQLPEGSFALFGFHFGTERELGLAFQSIGRLLKNPGQFLPANTRIAVNCRAVLFTYFHGRHSLPNLGAKVHDADARSLFPIIQTTYTMEAPECADLPEFLDIMHHQLFAFQSQFAVPVSLLSLGCCNILRAMTEDSPAFHRRQNEMSRTMLQSLADELSVDIIVPQGSPHSANLVLESMSMVRLMAMDRRVTSLQAVQQSTMNGSCPYAFFNSHHDENDQDVIEAKELSLFERLNQFEIFPTRGKEIINRTIIERIVERGWAVKAADLLDWLREQQLPTDVTLNKGVLGSAMATRTHWLACKFRYDGGSKPSSRCYVLLQ